MRLRNGNPELTAVLGIFLEGLADWEMLNGVVNVQHPVIQSIQVVARVGLCCYTAGVPFSLQRLRSQPALSSEVSCA